MKRYYNSTTKEWYTEGLTLTRKIDNGVFAGIPSDEQLYEWGFREWIEPAPTPEQMLEQAKEWKTQELMAYDSSEAVNGFTYHGVEMWLDKATRDGLHLRLTAEQAAGMERTTLWFGGQSFELPIKQAFQLLYAIEVYASKCYDRTAAHAAAIAGLPSVEAVEAYDFTTGYPDKIVIDDFAN